MNADEAHQLELEARQWAEHRTLVDEFRDECRAFYEKVTGKWKQYREPTDGI